MANIERLRKLDEGRLSGELYMSSLIAEAVVLGMLSENEAERIQLSCLNLLADKINRYTNRESSSVRVEVAENIMKSVIYTIGLCLKSYLSPDDAIEALQTKTAEELYRIGRRKIDIKLNTARLYHSLTLSNLTDTDNYTYHATLEDGIKGFFKIYNADYAAHEIGITVDYPIFNPVKGLTGVEFIGKYLESVYYENSFCRLFSPLAIRMLLLAYNPDCKNLIFNIFGQVLTCVIGCTLAGEDVFNLSLSEDNVKLINNLIGRLTVKETEAEFYKAACNVADLLRLTNSAQRRYVLLSVLKIANDAHRAAVLGRLETVFVCAQYKNDAPVISFSSGARMDDERYKRILDEISECRYSSDKTAIIMRNIKSAPDLEDIISDADLSKDEIFSVLESFGAAELAVLIKRNPDAQNQGEYGYDEREDKLSAALGEFVLSLSTEKQEYIANTVSLLEEEAY